MNRLCMHKNYGRIWTLKVHNAIQNPSGLHDADDDYDDDLAVALPCSSPLY